MIGIGAGAGIGRGSTAGELTYIVTLPLMLIRTLLMSLFSLFVTIVRSLAGSVALTTEARRVLLRASGNCRPRRWPTIALTRTPSFATQRMSSSSIVDGFQTLPSLAMILPF